MQVGFPEACGGARGRIYSTTIDHIVKHTSETIPYESLFTGHRLV
jgi:hypothetical protein